MSSKKKSKICSFHPDDLATRVAGFVNRDLLDSMPVGQLTAEQLYSGEYSAASIYAYKQSTEILKKYSRIGKPNPALAVQAFTTFSETCTRLGLVDGADDFSARKRALRSNCTSFILSRAANLIRYMLPTRTSVEDLFQECKHSTGTTRGVLFSDCSLEAKMDYPLTGTPEAIELFRRYLQWDPALQAALESYNKYSTNPMYQVLDGSRASTVAKNDETDRMIAIEPTLNMFFQQGMMTLMVKALKVFGLDLETMQETHKTMALFSSITAKLGTIDWSSASDSVLMKYFIALFPPDWSGIICKIRSPSMEIDGRIVTLPMISTMGNATTFPIETIVFYSLAAACVSYRTDPTSSTHIDLSSFNMKDVSVYGDDCILPVEDCALFISICNTLGFVVNEKKTFINDVHGECFRESCGGDYFAFHNVRPMFLSAATGVRSSDVVPWLCSVFNALKEKYISFFGELNYLYKSRIWRWFFHVFKRINMAIPVVPDDFPDDAGLKILSEERFQILFRNLKLKYPAKSKSGSYQSSYFTWKFREARASWPDIRYAVWLKDNASRVLPEPKKGSIKRVVYLRHFAKTFQTESGVPRVIDKKQNGGYVLAKGVIFG